MSKNLSYWRSTFKADLQLPARLDYTKPTEVSGATLAACSNAFTRYFFSINTINWQKRLSDLSGISNCKSSVIVGYQ